MLDIDGTLRFLALDVVLVNNDGYWVAARADYSLYQDPSGRFHLIPSDMNEAFRARAAGRAVDPEFAAGEVVGNAIPPNAASLKTRKAMRFGKTAMKMPRPPSLGTTSPEGEPDSVRNAG